MDFRAPLYTQPRMWERLTQQTTRRAWAPSGQHLMNADKNIVARRALDKLQISREKFSAFLCRASEDSYKRRGKNDDEFDCRVRPTIANDALAVAYLSIHRRVMRLAASRSW